MNEDMHGAIRGLYEGILDAQAWQRSLHTISSFAGCAHASMIVRDTDRDLYLGARQAVEYGLIDSVLESTKVGVNGK